MFIATCTDVEEYGAQRRVHVQVVTNKRRLKRGRKKKEKSTLSLEDRAAHIFLYGSILDYTHPKEVDPLWDVLYRQYEYLVYIDLMYRCAIRSIDHSLSVEDIRGIIVELEVIDRYKKKLLGYMLNFMNMMYGSVIQSRFYGWKSYIDDFISRFNEVAMSSLTKLKFNPDQTRCSVYFYQAFWLSGLSLINKISENLSSQYNDGMQFDTNQSIHPEVEYDVILEQATSDEIEILGDEKGTLLNTEEIQSAQVGMLEDTDKSVYEWTGNEEAQNNTENELFICLKKIIYQLDIQIDCIYSMNDNALRSLGRRIKKEITAKTIILTTHERQLINKVFKRKVQVS